MKHALLLLLAACTVHSADPKEPPPPADAGCAQACVWLDRNCADDGYPTDAGTTCADVCENVESLIAGAFTGAVQEHGCEGAK